MKPISPLIDRFGRRVDYLRVSLTDRCNFRCVYCMPEEGFPPTPKDEQLTSDEIVRLISVAASLGISKIRLTGGEPLLRRDLPQIIQAIAAHPGVDEISCTTNGDRLAELAPTLSSSGLTRLNISLDTLRSDRFLAIARRGSLDRVLEGIDAALAVGLTPIKLNVVAMAGVNDDEAADFARWTMRAQIHVRFIELMPMRWSLDEMPEPFDTFRPHGDSGLLTIRQAAGGMLSDLEMRRRFISSERLRGSIETELGALEPAEVVTNGPARTYRLPGSAGTIGFISQITHDFCAKCNRLRLTHDGFLRPCLMSDGELDLRTALRGGATDEDLRALFWHVVDRKPERHHLAEGQVVVGRGMSQIGG